MRAVSRCGIIAFFCFLLAGCGGSQSAEKYQKVEENVTTESETETEKENNKNNNDVTEYQEEQEPLDTSLIWYVPDSHFYETSPQPFIVLDKILGYGEEVVYNLEVLEAFASKNPADGGEYFKTSEWLQELQEWGEGEGMDTILFVKIRLTNPGAKAEEVCIGELDVYKRVPGGIKNEFSDQCLEPVHNGQDFDKPMVSGDMFYYVKIEPGESLETTLAYVVSSKDLKEKLYMQCFSVMGAEWDVYNASENRREPSNDENVRFVRVHVRE